MLAFAQTTSTRSKQKTIITMKSFGFSTLVAATASFVSAVCPTGQVRVTLLGGVSNEEFCQVSGSCGMCELLKTPSDSMLTYAPVTMPEKWTNQMELFSMEGKTCGAFFKFVPQLSPFSPSRGHGLS